MKTYEEKGVKLYNGDCLEVMDKLFEEGIKFDAIITDPPYGLTACKWDSTIPFDKMWNSLKKIRNDNTPIVIFGSEPFSSSLRMSNIKEYKYDWIWIKNQATNHLHAKRMPMRKSENISVFFEKASWYNPQKTDGHPPTNSAKGCSNGIIYYGKNIRSYDGGDTTRMPLNILSYNCVNNYSKIHPNEKPLELLKYLVKTYTNEGDIILDFTMGSGTTGVASKKLNRKFIGIELDEGYFDTSVDRIKNTEVYEENE